MHDIGDSNGIFDDDYFNDTTAYEAWQYGHDAFWWYYNRFGRYGYDNDNYELEVYIHARVDGGIAAYYAVLTRLLPPMKSEFSEKWPPEKKALYQSITPEQKLFIYAARAEDPVATIQRLPYWHPFYNEAMKLGMNIYSSDTPNALKYYKSKDISMDYKNGNLAYLGISDKINITDTELKYIIELKIWKY